MEELTQELDACSGVQERAQALQAENARLKAALNLGRTSQYAVRCSAALHAWWCCTFGLLLSLRWKWCSQSPRAGACARRHQSVPARQSGPPLSTLAALQRRLGCGNGRGSRAAPHAVQEADGEDTMFMQSSACCDHVKGEYRASVAQLGELKAQLRAMLVGAGVPVDAVRCAPASACHAAHLRGLARVHV